MKTFNEKDLITWANREKAVIGDAYYFSDTIDILNDKIKRNDTSPLASIKNGTIWHPFVNNNGIAYTCILPVNKVIEKEPEKKFRPLKNIEEFYELIFDTEGKSEQDCIYELIYDCILHLKSKRFGDEYFTAIRGICKNEDIQILIDNSFTFEELFDEFEIELNCKWVPFGISDEDAVDATNTED